MSEEKLKTIKVYVTESYETWLRREVVELNIEDYPELDGKTKEEILEYIEKNNEDMKSTDESSYDSLSDQLWDRDIEREKTYKEESAINVEL